MGQRIEYIDIAKGISIALVAMAHCHLKDHFPGVIDSMGLFRMPLFFLLSGVFFSWALAPKQFLLKKTEALIKPYFFMLLVFFTYGALFGKDVGFHELIGFLYGNGATIPSPFIPMWFLTHLFIVYFVSYILFRYLNFSQMRPFTFSIILLIFFIIGLVFIDFFWHKKLVFLSSEFKLPGLPFSLDIVLISSFFFILGHKLKGWLLTFSPRWYMTMISLVAFIVIALLSDAKMDLNQRIFHSPIYTTLGAFSGIYFILSISHYISKSPTISYLPKSLGVASLYVLIFHIFIENKVYFYFENKVNTVFLAFCSFLVGIFFPLFIKWVVERNAILSIAFLPIRSNKLFTKIFRKKQASSPDLA